MNDWEKGPDGGTAKAEISGIQAHGLGHATSFELEFRWQTKRGEAVALSERWCLTGTQAIEGACDWKPPKPPSELEGRSPPLMHLSRAQPGGTTRAAAVLFDEAALQSPPGQCEFSIVAKAFEKPDVPLGKACWTGQKGLAPLTPCP